MTIAAIAGGAMLLALALGSAMGVGLMLYLTQDAPLDGLASTSSPAPRSRPAAPPAQPAATAPSGPTTIAPPTLPERPPPASDDPVAAMMADLVYERTWRPEAPLVTPAPSTAPPTVVESIVAAVQRLVGIDPGPVPTGLEPVEPAREVVSVEAPPVQRALDPAPAPVVAPEPEPEPVATLTPAPEPEPVAMLDRQPEPRTLPDEPQPDRRVASSRSVPAPAPAPLPTGPIDLDDDDLDDDIFGDDFDEADVFVAPKIEDEPAAPPPLLDREPEPEPETLGGGFDTILVEVVIDEAEVPIRVDGRDMGTVPGVVQVPPGIHTVELYYRGEYTRFTLPASQDPERWCFESKGRDIKRVDC